MNNKALMLLFAAVVIGLLSCKKGTGDIVPPVIQTKLNVINASSDTLNFYENGTRINNTSNLYPFGSLGGSLGNSLNYLLVNFGLQNYQFKKAGSPNTLVSVPLTLDTAATYTLFMAGETTDKVFLLRDSLIANTGAAATNTAYVRFVNAAPAAGNLDVIMGSNISLKSRAFKSATRFLSMPSGTDSLKVYLAGNTMPLKSGTITLVSGNFYTLFTKGTLTGTGNDAFGARIITNPTY